MFIIFFISGETYFKKVEIPEGVNSIVLLLAMEEYSISALVLFFFLLVNTI